MDKDKEEEMPLFDQVASSESGEDQPGSDKKFTRRVIRKYQQGPSMYQFDQMCNRVFSLENKCKELDRECYKINRQAKMIADSNYAIQKIENEVHNQISDFDITVTKLKEKVAASERTSNDSLSACNHMGGEIGNLYEKFNEFCSNTTESIVGFKKHQAKLTCDQSTTIATHEDLLQHTNKNTYDIAEKVEKFKDRVHLLDLKTAKMDAEIKKLEAERAFNDRVNKLR